MSRKKSEKAPDRLKPVLGITLSEQAKGRKAHNQSRPAKPHAGDFFSATSQPEDKDRLDRALSRSYETEQIQKEASRKGKPRPGEILSADSGPSEEQQEKDRVRDFLHLATERFKLASDAESHWRAEALDDLEFRSGKQWPDDIKTSRDLDKAPCLTMNRLPQFIRQVCNEQRQQRPAIQVNPVGDGADTDTAEVLQGIIRHIEVGSDAEIAYDTAFEQCVTSGIGWYRIRTDYASPRGFDQEIIIEPIKNPFTVYDDPAASGPIREDARFRFVVEDVPIEVYRNHPDYKHTEAAGLNDFKSIGDDAPEWATRDTIRIAEYFHMEEEMVTLYQMPDKSVMDEDEIEKMLEGEDGQAKLTEEEKETFKSQLTSRKIPVSRCVWSKINAIEIIDERKLPIEHIPVIPVIGDDLEINGKRHIAGVVRHMKDPQRMYNYWISAATEKIALDPKSPFIAAEGQIENHEAEWQAANIRRLAVLQYKPVGAGGTLAPPPARQVLQSQIDGYVRLIAQADNDLKAIIGLHEPSLGQNKSDQSGKAISLLQKQGDVATLNFSDNLSRSIRHTARILLEYIPHVYDAPRVQRIIKPDQTVDHVIVHNQQGEAGRALLTQSLQKIYDIGVGRYDVTVSVGNVETKRQEAIAGQMALIQAFPNVFGVAGDIMVANFPWPQAKEMAKRIKKTLPPQLLDDDATDPETQNQILNAKLSQIMQQHQQMTQMIQKQTQIIEAKVIEQQGKLEAVKIQASAQITVAELNKATTLAKSQMDAAQRAVEMAHDSSHELAMRETAPEPEPAGATQ